MKCESSKGKIRDVTDTSEQRAKGGENFTPVDQFNTNEVRHSKAFDFNVGGKNFTLKPDAGWGSNNAIQAWGLDVQAYKKIAKLPQNIQDRFISDMAQNVHNKKSIIDLTNKIISQKFKLFGIEEKPITWITPTVLKYLQDTQKLKIQSPVITFEARQVKHSLGASKTVRQKLTEIQFKNIYDTLNGDYDELFYDTEMPAIMYIKRLPKDEIIDGRDCIAVPVNINCKRTDRPVNYIGTTKRVNIDNIRKDKRYKKIE